jgi:hypothetical protein
MYAPTTWNLWGPSFQRDPRTPLHFTYLRCQIPLVSLTSLAITSSGNCKNEQKFGLESSLCFQFVSDLPLRAFLHPTVELTILSFCFCFIRRSSSVPVLQVVKWANPLISYSNPDHRVLQRHVLPQLGPQQAVLGARLRCSIAADGPAADLPQLSRMVFPGPCCDDLYLLAYGRREPPRGPGERSAAPGPP